MRTYVAVMQSTPNNRVSKYQDFDTQQEAQNHIDAHAINYPDAFVQTTINEPLSDWLIDIIAKTISFVPSYAVSVTTARQRKRKEELKIAMVKFVAYRDSSPKITDAQLATYKATLSSTYDTEETNILAINTGTLAGDIQAIKDYVITWPDPA